MERIELTRFAAEVSQRFEFLIDQYGMEGPESSDLLLPGVFYRHPELLVAVFLNQGRDQPGRRIEVVVSLAAAQLSGAALPGLVEAAGFAPAHHVAWKAHTVAAMQHALGNNATWLSRLMPVLLGPEASGQEESPVAEAAAVQHQVEVRLAGRCGRQWSHRLGDHAGCSPVTDVVGRPLLSRARLTPGASRHRAEQGRGPGSHRVRRVLRRAECVR
jgi:hypothetical protein